jgi:hypothetical protein
VVKNRQTSINYLKLGKAYRYLRENKDCHFILTNDGALRSLYSPRMSRADATCIDSTFPVGKGQFFPGSLASLTRLG